MTDWVRPTHRSLNELGLPAPDLGVLLHELEHPLVMRAQQVPERTRSGGSERVRSIADRIFFKVKTSHWRGAVCEIDPIVPHIAQTWWLVAAGNRAADSPQHDFYDHLKSETHRAGPNSCDSSALLPSEWDKKRLTAEAATNAARLVRNLTRLAATESLKNGDIRGFAVAKCDIRVRLSVHDDGRAYVAVGAVGGIDATLMVAVLSALPSLGPDDWMPEPSEILGLQPAQGEILWSAMMQPDAQTALMTWADER